jgi:preprotein translocase SecE subunit
MATVNKSSDASGKKPQKQDAGNSAGEGLIEYLKGVRSEWGKISWPTWPQIWGQTIIVLVMVTIMTLALFILDNSFRFIIEHITPPRG